MRKEVMALTRRAEVAEEGQAASRREQRRNAERVASTIEAKARQVTEVKRGLVSSNELLKRSNTDLSARLTEAKSRAAKEAAAHDACMRLLRQHKQQMASTLKEKVRLLFRAAMTCVFSCSNFAHLFSCIVPVSVPLLLQRRMHSLCGVLLLIALPHSCGATSHICACTEPLPLAAQIPDGSTAWVTAVRDGAAHFARAAESRARGAPALCVPALLVVARRGAFRVQCRALTAALRVVPRTNPAAARNVIEARRPLGHRRNPCHHQLQRYLLRRSHLPHLHRLRHPCRHRLKTWHRSHQRLLL